MMSTIHLIFLLVSTCFVSITSSSSSSPFHTSNPKSTLVLLDVDSTLYVESQVGIEAQIVKNTHQYCKSKLGISKQEADDLYQKYGSTIEGLRHTAWKDLNNGELHRNLLDFYESVYQNIDMSRLFDDTKDTEDGGSTGYTHKQDMNLACELIKACPHPIVLASNSPSWHVEKVLRCMGLDKVKFLDIVTPDRSPNYPTKHTPATFLRQSSVKLEEYDKILFMDDSLTNLKCTSAYLDSIVPIHIHPDKQSLSTAFLNHLGLLDAAFSFDTVQYLTAKNDIDKNSINAEIWNQMILHLRRILQKKQFVAIADVGAGRLSILTLLKLGNASTGLDPLMTEPNEDAFHISYTAYESNALLFDACQDELKVLGFELEKQISTTELIYTNGNWSVRLVLRAFDDHKNTEESVPKDLNMIVGCCFADLMEPTALTSSLFRSFQLQEVTSKDDGLLFYFPITFTGTTQFLPPQPFTQDENTKKIIPSDTVAFQTYSRELEETMGHNLEPCLLEEVMASYGVRLLTKGKSNWKINASIHPLMFETMMYFFGRTTGVPLLRAGMDAAGWIHRARENRPEIEVSNCDLLFQIGGEKSMDYEASCIKTKVTEEKKLEEIQFVAPRKVTTVTKDIPSPRPDEVVIESSLSLISSGTELKVFKGLFEDAALDVNIEGMENERMAFPLSYGYCLVGRIIEVGEGVPSSYLGRLVFTFASHASHVVAKLDAVQLVPPGISAEDAIFMPSVETALSLVHDAHIRTGENVAVYGQGLIGLLVTGILSFNSHSSRGSGKFGAITTFDTIPERLAASSKMGSTQALLPGSTAGPFDCTIEVSGNGRALQSAIDATSDGGRVIVGSWYGNTDISLQLGMDFHRSHKIIRTSQVSEIPAHLSGLWDKKRRFELTWNLVKRMKPSSLLTKTYRLNRATEAYLALEDGNEIAIAFAYPK